MIDRRFFMQSLAAAITTALSRGASAAQPHDPAEVLLAELARLEARAYSEEGIPVFLACEDLAGTANGAPAGFTPGPMNAGLAEAYRNYAALLPGLERERTEYDAAEIVELLAERDFNAGGVR